MNYITIANSSDVFEQIIKKSRFILNVMRITDEEDAKTKIQQIKKLHHKANHNVFAYVLGDDSPIQRYSDDGEPSGTAGVPMLEVLKTLEMRNTLTIVTRYFGGIKLGAGGLIRAYAGTVANGLQELPLIQRISRRKLTLTTDYKNLEKIKYWLNEHHFDVVDESYAEQVQLVIPVAEPETDDVQMQLQELFAGGLLFNLDDLMYFEIPYTTQKD